MVETQHVINDKPSVTRYPRGNGYGEELLNDIYGLAGTNSSVYVNGEMPVRGRALPIGKGRIVKEHSKVETHTYTGYSISNTVLFYYI